MYVVEPLQFTIRIDVNRFLVFHQTYEGMAMNLVKVLEKLLFNCFSFSNVSDDWLKTETEIEIFLLISLDIINSIPCRENNALDETN